MIHQCIVIKAARCVLRFTDRTSGATDTDHNARLLLIRFTIKAKCVSIGILKFYSYRFDLLVTRGILRHADNSKVVEGY